MLGSSEAGAFVVFTSRDRDTFFFGSRLIHNAESAACVTRRFAKARDRDDERSKWITPRLAGHGWTNYEMDDCAQGTEGLSEGFPTFPRRLPDDTIEYCLYIVDSTLSPVELESRLTAVCTAAEGFREKYLKHYIWQRDSFSLTVETKDGQ